MNRSNISKQLNYGDLSRFVGQPVGQQFAKKRYAEGDTVAEELTGRVTYEDVNGKKRTYMFDPLKMERPDSTGRGKVIGVDYKTAAYKPGVNFFDYAQLVEEPAEQIARQEQEVPVSVSVDFWTDDYEDTPTGPMTSQQMLDSMKSTNSMLPFISNIPIVGGLLGRAARSGRDATQKEYRELLSPEENVPGLSGSKDTRDNFGNLVTGASLDRDFAGSRGKAEQAYKKGYSDDGTIEKSGNKKDSGMLSQIGDFVAGLFGGLSDDENINALQNQIIMNMQDGYGQGSNLNQFGFSGGVDQGSGWDSDKWEGSFQSIKDDIDAQAGSADAYFQDDSQAASDFRSGISSYTGESLSDDSESLAFDDDDFDLAKGGIAQLAPGGIAPSDKPLDPGSFVISADVVSGVGDGSTESGIERMSGLLGIPLDGSVSGPNGSMLGRVTTADGGPVPGTGLSDSVSTVIQDTDTVRLSAGLGVNNPLNQLTPQGKTAARVARDELVVDTRTLKNLPAMFGGGEPNLKEGQQMLTNFMANVRANKTNTGGKQPGPLVPEGQDVMKGLASFFQRA